MGNSTSNAIFRLIFIVALASLAISVMETYSQTRRSSSRPKAKATPTPEATPTPPIASQQDQNLWTEVSRINTKSSYRFYLSDQPNGVFAEESRRRIKAIEEEEELLKWKETVTADTKSSFEKYLREYPEGRFLSDALDKIRSFEKSEEMAKWVVATSFNEPSRYLDYLEKYPYGANAGVARLRLAGFGVRAPITVYTNSIGMEFSWVPAGSFITRIEGGRHRLVTIRQGFWVGRYEVTQGQYESVMGTNPSNFKNCGKDCPVETVSWNDAKEFISRLNARNDGFVYSLPSEAEWEYVARAGTTTAFAFGDSLSSTQANFNGNHPHGNAAKGPNLERTIKVGSYRPNEWGLYDMHGNVWEWVEDIWGEYNADLPMDGSAITSREDRSLKVVRGGSWGSRGQENESDHRRGFGKKRSIFDLGSDIYQFEVGFRVVARAR